MFGLFAGLFSYIFRKQIGTGVKKMPSLSTDGISLLKKEEGLRLWPYDDGVGNMTIGYGHKILPGENYSGGITREQAEALLTKDSAFARQAVNDKIVVPLNQNQFDALVSLTFNIGKSAFQNSTLARVLNEGRYNDAASAILDWKFAGGKPILLKRREREREIFLT